MKTQTDPQPTCSITTRMRRTALSSLTAVLTTITLCVTALCGVPVAGAVLPENPDQWPRIYGADRYITSAIVAEKAWQRPARVYIVSGANYPDALSAASFTDGPIILANPAQTYMVADTINAAFPGTPQLIIGGSAAVPGSLNSHLPYAKRLYGKDRYETSLLVAKTAWTNPTRVYIVSGVNYPDALSAASFTDGPILLADPTNPARTRQMIENLGNPTPTLIGGHAALPASYDTMFPTANRIAGKDRYDTSRKIAALAWPGHPKAYLVSGANYPDALSAASFTDGPIILIQPGQGQHWKQTLPGYTDATLIGGYTYLPTTPPTPQPRQPHRVLEV